VIEPRRERGPKRARYQGIEVKLTLLYRAEHEFIARKFHQLCDGKGATITLIQARNGWMAAAYNGESWGLPWGHRANPRGFITSIVDDPAAIGGFSLHNFSAIASVFSNPYFGPDFGMGLGIADRCHENDRSFSGYGEEGVNPFILFGGSHHFRFLEYEVYQVEGLRATV
jgi:hypothetical protein